MFPELRRDVAFPVVGTLVLFALLVGGGLLYSALQDGAASDKLVTSMFIDAIMVIGIQIYIGNTGVFSFGHVGFGAIAGYTFALFAIAPAAKATRIAEAPFGLADVSTGPVMATVIAVGVTLVIAVIVGIGLARSGARSGAVAATVITLALLFVAHEVARSWVAVTGGDRAGLTFGIGDTLGSRVPIYLALLATILVARLFAQSRSGRFAHAAREDDLAARAMGINPTVQQTVALLVSVVVVAVAASLRVYEVGSILPGLFFFNYTLLTLVMLVVGGRNSVSGAMLGVAVITAARELARRMGSEGYEAFGLGLDGAPLDWIFREGLPRVVLGLAMVGFMIWRPNGLIDDWELDGWLRNRLRRGDPRPTTRLEAAPKTRTELVATDVTVDFGGFRALDGADMVAASDEIVGLIGPNGAGKTTLVNVMTGMVEPSTGKVRLGEKDLTRAPSHEIARAGLVRTFQNLRLFSSLTVWENVEISWLVASRHRPGSALPGIDEIVDAAGLWEHRDRRASELDYGNSRRLELARAAALGPTFLLLDEPTSGMSDEESLEMITQVRHMASVVGAGVLVIDHDLNFITGICDRIYCLDQGAVIASGTPDEVQADAQVRAAYLGSMGPT
jgi:branched-chain amino acid transport system ATP-binding protein/branched-chain amino acid transport system permease protein